MINNNEKRAKAPASHMENRVDTVYIKDIHVGMKNLTLTCIVLEVGPPVLLKENREVRTAKVADQTACINLAVWDDLGHCINASDILRLTKAYATTWRDSLTLYTSKAGTVEKIGEFCMVFNDQLNMSEMVIQAPPPNNPPNGGGGNNNNRNANSSNDNNTTNSTVTTNTATISNANSGFMSRNAAAQPSHSAASSSSRYHDMPTRNNSRNGQPSDSGAAANPRSRGERR